jgi:Uma2 family endonuclease
MLTILEEPTVRERALPISVDAYHCLIAADLVSEKAELIRGVIVEKMSKSPLHTFYSKRLYRLLQNVVPVGYSVQKEDPLTLGDSEPEPDLAVVLGGEEDYIHHHPNTALLIVEVAASNERLDREMASIYAEADVSEYWILLVQKQAIEIYHTPVNGVYQSCNVYGHGEEITSTAIPGWKLKVSEIFQDSSDS